MEIEPQHRYPLALGNEEETGFIIKLKDGEWLELDQFDNDFFKSFDDYNYANKVFKKNGTKFYPGGATNQNAHTNPERATPECRDPKELAVYIESSFENFLDDVSEYIERHNEYTGYWPIEAARVHRRVIDSYGSTKGCHDSIDMSHMSPKQITAHNNVMSAHVMSRMFVTGSGYVGEDGKYYFSQKMSNVERIIGGKAYGNSLIHDRDYLQSVELRSADPNTSQWAAIVRLGSSALVSTMMSTPLAKEIHSFTSSHAIPMITGKVTDITNLIKSHNTYDFRGLSEYAIKTQQFLASLAVNELQEYVEFDSDYFTIASEWERYVQDYSEFINGNLDLTGLADRADWARKLVGIYASIENDSSFGIARELGDMKSRQNDLQYDMVRLTADESGIQRKYGWGYVHEKKKDKNFYSNKDITRAQYIPPPTRAQLRRRIIEAYSEYNVGEDWLTVTVSDANDNTLTYIPLPRDPSATKLTREGKQAMHKLSKMGIFSTDKEIFNL